MRPLALVCLCLCALCLPCSSQTGDGAFSQLGTVQSAAPLEEAGLEIGVAKPNRNMTITESADFENLGLEETGGDFHFDTIDESVSEALTEYAAGQREVETAGKDREVLRDLLLTAVIECLLIAIVLHITLGVGGFSGAFGRAVATGAGVAIAGGTIGYSLQTGLFDPLRIAVSFLVLALLLKGLLKLERWGRVFRTAVPVLIISLGLVWLGHSAVSTLLGF
jgi:hypothetical protein